MAIFHLSVKTVSRSAGRSSTAAAAYRAGVEITDERTGEIHDYERKSGVESAELFLPSGSPEWATDRAKLWNAAEQSEKRKNSTVAREFEVALPSELSADQRQELAHDFARELVKRHGFAVDAAIHAPGKDGDSKNHHAHILCTTRKLTAEGFTEKTRELDDRATGAAEVTRWREQWAGLTNAALERAGHDARVDHRSLEAQGIDREPTVHLGPSATAIERRGDVSEKTQHHQERQAEAAGKVAALVAIAQAQVKAQQEIDDDRIRNETISFLDSNVNATARASTAARKSGTATDRACAFAHSDHTGIDENLAAASGDLGRAIEGAKRRIAERHYDRVVESARRQFKRVSGVVQQLVDHIGHVVSAVASAAHQVAQQVAVHLELARQRVAALPRETRSAMEVWAASPDNPINQIAQQPAQTAPASADKAAAAYRSSRAKTGAPPPLTEQEAQAKLLEVSNEMQAQWNAAVVAERALYLQEMTAQAHAKAVAHVAEHQAHIDAKPMLLGRDKWEAQRQRFENRDSSNKLAWQELKSGKYPFLTKDKEAVQKAVERRVSDKKPELAQSMPKVAVVLQVERERLAAEKHAQGLAERQREREAREARETSNRKDKARGNKGPSR